MKPPLALLLTLLTFIVSAPVAYPHGGGLNSYLATSDALAKLPKIRLNR